MTTCCRKRGLAPSAVPVPVFDPRVGTTGWGAGFPHNHKFNNPGPTRSCRKRGHEIENGDRHRRRSQSPFSTGPTRSCPKRGHEMENGDRHRRRSQSPFSISRPRAIRKRGRALLLRRLRSSGIGGQRFVQIPLSQSFPAKYQGLRLASPRIECGLLKFALQSAFL